MDLHSCEPSLVEYAERLCKERLTAYKAAPHDAEEHANVETSVLAGGYGYRQIAELVQNAADAISDTPDPAPEAKIVIAIDETGLWAANSGAPLDKGGVRALLNAHTSGKRAGQIGRFGLGFKSLLRLGGRIDVLSRTVCLRFDPEACRERIRTELGLAPEAPAPGLRLATPCTWHQGLAMRPGAERFSWAATVVFAELKTPGAREAVLEELRRFPQEFLLFLPHDVELELTGGKVERLLRRASGSDGTVSIENLQAEDFSGQRWHIFQTHVAITDAAALADATGVHARERVPLIWAAPATAGREAAGRFFAFFPTATETRTLGILNAPWKLNSDRTALIPGDWNSALMDAAAELIVSNLPAILRDDDPGVPLDAFPRELQNQTDPAAPLVQALWNRLVDAAVLANCDGALLAPQELRRAPEDQSELIRAWSRLASPEACAAHLHPTCTSTPARISRLNQLAERLASEDDQAPRLARTAPLEWLGIAATDDPDAAIETLQLADAWAKRVRSQEWEAIRDEISIILTSGGTLARAPDVTYQNPAPSPLKSIHPALLADSSACRILKERFRIVHDVSGDWERLLTVRIAAAEECGDWNSVWELLRQIPHEHRSELLNSTSLRVLTLDRWAEPEHVIRLGQLIDTSDLLDLPDQQSAIIRSWLIDAEYHRHDNRILDVLKIGDTPGWQWRIAIETKGATDGGSVWLQAWLRSCRRSYWIQLGCRPDKALLEPDVFQMPHGWDLLLGAEGTLRHRLTELLLTAVCYAPQQLAPVRFHHRTRPNTWKSAEFSHPLHQLLLEYGALSAAGTTISMKALLIPEGPDRARNLPSLAHWIPELEQVLKAAPACTNQASTPEIWHEWLEFASHEKLPAQSMLPLYEEAAAAGEAPTFVCSTSGPVSTKDVLIAKTITEVDGALNAGFQAISLPPVIALLWERRGARLLSSVSTLKWTPSTASAETVLVTELEPVMCDVLRPECLASAGIVFASDLTQRLGAIEFFPEWTEYEGRLLVQKDVFNRYSWAERVLLLCEASAACGWLQTGADPKQLISSGVQARRRAVAAQPDLPSRLLQAVGSPEVLCALFDREVAEQLAAQPKRAARVSVTLLGPALLAEPGVREAMKREGLSPPERWGSEAAAEFVAALGFPPEFAISPTRRREPELLVEGPVTLKPLHGYQERVVGGLEALLEEPPEPRRRAVISLPTGAGKTRVAAQTMVTKILCRASNQPRLVIWIAQTDELCEQAVQCFRELWINVGSPGEPLRIARLWGGQSNPQPPDGNEATVVVATIQTLTSRLSGEPLAWLHRPGAVVIDECHHALTPSYTELFRNFAHESGEPPFIGLSATPFRGRSDEETRQLARRFDNHLLPANQGGLFEELQKDGVLARFTYTKLEMQQRFELTDEEQHHLELFKRLPESALERLGSNQERNQRILAELLKAQERSTLLFATSVAHARRLAAHLNLLEIPAAVVSGESDKNSRRWFIEAFRSGTIRVLCNHSALTTGFDAPATDLIVIARPVFSPSMFMQMVGRGLRGPANGGKPTCRILTVQDNLERFSGELAHHYFEKYYL